ncbi:MAG TPA: Stk1 family PASTA domain-containing Ser/Thr kinase [Actinomycetota bacterium]|jgi:serine/threonine-protein kinase|nr:Stk1 family PASTA domain-containing Ser/Thr kinase [Actinomycetota bacterium]
MIETTVDGRYQIVARIASGGMGEVFRAHDPVLDRDVALKVLHNALAQDAGFIERFRREARSAGMLSHPNIVQVHDWGETGDTYFMVMEFIRGPNLRTVLMKNGPLAPAQALEIASQMLAALEHAHEQGIVHRDVKPENILITRKGVVKVADFGLARALAAARVSHAPGTVTGTVQYLSPEQIEGEAADARTDLYSVGIVLYELLVGKVPFSGETSLAIAYKHLRERVPPPSGSNPMVPPSLDRVVLSATERDRDRRTPDARTMRAELSRAAAELPPASPLSELVAQVPPAEEVPADRAATVTIPRAESPKSRRRRVFRRSITTLAMFIVLAALGWAAWAYVIPHRTTVPNVQGKTVQAAEAAADEAGLQLALSSQAFSSTVPAGHIINQDPEPGARAEKGSELSVVLSRGPQLVEIPSVRGKPEQQARKELRGLGLVVNVDRQYHDKVPQGDVIDQNPSAGTTIEVGKTVKLVVSRGKPPVEVPDLVGRTEQEAGALVTGAGLALRVTEEFSDTVPRGRVISQDPKKGTVVRKGDTVTIVVSKGPRTFPMPDVVGMSKDAATAKLQGLGLRVRVVDLPGSSGQTVVGQQPQAGTTVESGQQVTIYVGG